MANKRLSSNLAPSRTDATSTTYKFQSKVPALPIPSLESTAAKYLNAIRPFVSDPHPDAPVASDTNPTKEYSATKKAVDEFLKSDLVKDLQKRLEHRATQHESWLIDWFNFDSYMGYRDPIIPYVNYYYLHKDDKTRRTGPARAASLLRALLYFRRMVETEVIEPEMVKKQPLDMSTYHYLFNSVRIPEKPGDAAVKYPANDNNHIVVVRNNRFYEIEVVSKDGEFMSAPDMEKIFANIIKTADAAGPEEYPLGALTSENRDTWTDARANLIAAGPNNEAALRRIESAIILLVLDPKKPISGDEISWELWCGNGRNRFFDKHQLIVFDNGKSGYNGEHSCLDGTPTSRLNDWLCRSIEAGKIDWGTPASSGLPQPKEVTFKLNDKAKQDIRTAEKNFDELMGQHSLADLHYEGYGKNFIKSCKTSPDSWAQMIMQLAFYKLTGQVGATYESAQTRKFMRGRTEVIRSATPEAFEWVKSMEKEGVSDQARFELFKKAAKSHIDYATMAADAQGIDRHLYGLKKAMKEGEELPALYKDPAFSKSNHWVLSTSQLSSDYIAGWGYGEVVADGFGLSYSIHENALHWTITSKQRDVKALRHYLAEAATEVKNMVESASKDGGQPKAKL